MLHNPYSTTFVGNHTRSGQKPGWHFHVVLLHGEMVYDLDCDYNLNPIPMETYAEKMLDIHWESDDFEDSYIENTKFRYDFMPIRKGLSMFVIEIPAESYLNLHWLESEQGGRRNLGQNVKLEPSAWMTNRDLFPPQPLKKFLSSRYR